MKSQDNNSSQGRKTSDKNGPILMSPGGTFTAFTFSDETRKRTSMENIDNETVPGSSQEAGQSSPNPSQQSVTYTDTQVDLFGGAITVSMSSRFDDASNIRPIPDHQEVFIDKLSETSLIIELLDFEESIEDENAAKYYFEDLAQCNEAGSYSVIHTDLLFDATISPHISSNHSKCGLIGKQNVVKFRKRGESKEETIVIVLIVIRLKPVGTDMLITMNIPADLVPGVETMELGILQSLESVDSQIEGYPLLESLKKVLNSIRIVDWSLFA